MNVSLAIASKVNLPHEILRQESGHFATMSSLVQTTKILNLSDDWSLEKIHLRSGLTKSRMVGGCAFNVLSEAPW